MTETDWRDTGVRVIAGNQLDPNTAQTPGMNRSAAINFARVGAEKLWAGTVTIHPNAKTGAHHHGPVESVIYVVRGKARMRWGEKLEFTPRPGRAISSMCRLTCRTRRSTPIRANRSTAYWCAAARSRSWSTSTSQPRSSRSRSTGSIRDTRIRISELGVKAPLPHCGRGRDPAQSAGRVRVAQPARSNTNPRCP